MSVALAWLEPGPLSPLVAASAGEPWLAGPRYEGLLAPTLREEVAAVDLLASPGARAAALATSVPTGAAVARLSAVWVHTGSHRPLRLTLLLPATGRGGRRHGPVHRQVIGPDDVARYGGVAVTTPLRTVVDLLSFGDTPREQRGVAALLRAGLCPKAVSDHLATLQVRVPVARAQRRLAQVVGAGAATR